MYIGLHQCAQVRGGRLLLRAIHVKYSTTCILTCTSMFPCLLKVVFAAVGRSQRHSRDERKHLTRTENPRTASLPRVQSAAYWVSTKILKRNGTEQKRTFHGTEITVVAPFKYRAEKRNANANGTETKRKRNGTLTFLSPTVFPLVNLHCKHPLQS